jgi:hypothetical protein
MLAKIAWGFCRIAYEASADQCFPAPMRRLFQAFGLLWYWLALALDGRALQIRRELRAQHGRPRRHVALEHLRGLGLRARQWPAKAWTATRTVVSISSAATVAAPPGVPAWSLPDAASFRALGLGSVWTIVCPYCNRFHLHTPQPGPCTAQCRASGSYLLEYAGELPENLHNRFRRSIAGDWPKVLLEWPELRAGTAFAEMT